MAGKPGTIESVPIQQQEVAGGEDRVVTKDSGTGALSADTVRTALLKTADGRATVATQADMDNAAAAARQMEADRARALMSGGTAWDPVKGYALGAWDEFSFGGIPAAWRGMARLVGGEEGEASAVETMRRWRSNAPISYRLGQVAGFAGQVAATEGMAASLRATKLAEAEHFARAAKIAESEGRAAEAASLTKSAERATTLAEEAVRMEAAERAEPGRVMSVAEAMAAGKHPVVEGIVGKAIGESPWTAEASKLLEKAAYLEKSGTPRADRVASWADELASRATAEGDVIRQGFANRAMEDAGRLEALYAERAASRTTEADRMLRGAAEWEAQAASSGRRAAQAAEDAVIKRLGPSQAARGRIAEALARGEGVVEVPGVLSGIERSAAMGAAQGLGAEVSRAAMGDKPFSFEDAVAGMFAGAAIGGGTHIGASFAARGLSKAAAAFSQREAERSVAIALQEYGVTGREMEKITTRLGGYRGVAEELRKAGIDLSSTSPAELYGELAKAREAVGALRNRVMSSASAAGAGEHVNVAGLTEAAEKHLTGPRTVSGREIPVGAYERQRDAGVILKYFNKTMESLESTPAAKRLAKLDAIQSDLGKLAEKATPVGESVPTLKTELYRDLRSLVRTEMRNSVERAGESGTDFVTSYDAVNKTYATLRTFDRMARRGLKTGNTELAGAATKQGSVARVVGRAGLSTALFGAPYSVLYDAAGGSLFKALGRATNAIRRSAAGAAGALTATEAARQGFEGAIKTLSVKGAAGITSSVLSKNMTKYTDSKAFEKLVGRVTSGAIGADLVDRLSEVDPSMADKAAGWNAKLAQNVTAMLPRPSPYPVGYDRNMFSPAKGVLINPDQMKVLRYLDGVANPLEVPMKVVAGVAGPEHIKAVGDMYPTLLQHMKDGLMAGLLNGSFETTLIKFPEVRSAISSFAGIPVSAANSQEFASAVAEQRALERQRAEEAKQNGPPPRSSGAAGSNAQRYGTESERISE